MNLVVSACLALVGLIHLLPLPAVLGGKRLERLYGISAVEPSLQLLLRHRAILFAAIGVLCIAAATYSPLTATALVAALVSVLSFLVLALTTPGYNAQVRRVVVADLIALVCLLIAGVTFWMRA